MRRIMHGEDNAGDDLRHQTEGQNTAKSPPVIEVFRGRIINKAVMRQTQNRQARVHPFGEPIARIICAFTAHLFVLTNFDAAIADKFI